MIELPTVTLVCADCICADRAIKVIEKCKSVCTFGAIKLFTSIPTGYAHEVSIKRLSTLSDYSEFMLRQMPGHVHTKHLLTVQHDGWIINASSWNDDWLSYDYVAPFWIHNHIIHDRSVGSGGFSLRSKALSDRVSVLADPARFLSSVGWAHEDGVIALDLRNALVSDGFKFSPPRVACNFAQGGNRDPGYHIERPFGFHGMWPNINQETGIVGPWPSY